MAFRKNVDLKNGLPVVENCYIRINQVEGNKCFLKLAVNTYANQNAFLNGYQPLLTDVHGFRPSIEDTAPNFIKQGYEYLKTLLEFEGAVDA